MLKSDLYMGEGRAHHMYNGGQELTRFSKKGW